MRGRLAVFLLVAGVLASVAVAAVVLDRDTGADITSSGAATDGASPGASAAQRADPAVALDTALAEGKPAYILIHSLT